MGRLFSPWSAHAEAGMTPDNQALGDTVNSQLPALEVFRDAIGAGDFPLWNPLVGLGTPLGASLTKPFLSPFILPDLLLPLWYGAGVGALLRLVVLLAATYLFARELGLRPAAAGVAAAAFGF